MGASLTGLHRWQSPSSSKRRPRLPPMLSQSVLGTPRRPQACLSRTTHQSPGEIGNGPDSVEDCIHVTVWTDDYRSGQEPSTDRGNIQKCSSHTETQIDHYTCDAQNRPKSALSGES